MLVKRYTNLLAGIAASTKRGYEEQPAHHAQDRSGETEKAWDKCDNDKMWDKSQIFGGNVTRCSNTNERSEEQHFVTIRSNKEEQTSQTLT